MKKYLKMIIVLVLVAVFFFSCGFLTGFEQGYIAKEQIGMESCGFLYDKATNSYYYDIKNLNFTFTNETN